MAIDKLFSQNVGAVKPQEQVASRPLNQALPQSAPQVNEQAARSLVRNAGTGSVAGAFRGIESYIGAKANVDPRGLALIANVKGQTAEVRAEARGDQVASLSWGFAIDNGEVA